MNPCHIPRSGDLATEQLARVYGMSVQADKPATLRWIFSDITDNAFRWRSERSTDGADRQLQREYYAKRAWNR